MPHKSTLPPPVCLALGAVCIAFAPILVKCVDLSPTATGFYRCALGSTMLLLLSFRSRRESRSRPTSGGSFLAALLLAGLLFAADLAAWHRSVHWAGAGMGTILGNTQVIYMGLIGILWHRDRLTMRYGLAVPLAVVGVLLLVRVDPSSHSGDRYWHGVFFGLLTGAIYASFLMTMRWLESVRPGHGTKRTLGLVLAISSVALATLACIEGSFRIPSAMEWVWLFLLAVGPQVVGWMLITRSLPNMPVSRSGLILLLQPALAAVLGVVIFSEAMSGVQVLGAGVTLAAMYLATTETRRD